MRLGRRASTDRGQPGRAHRGRTVGCLAVAVLIVVGLTVADAGPARSAEGGHRTPARFVAVLEGRIVVVSARTGRVERHLTGARPGDGARQPTVSSDGRTVWFSRDDGDCAAHLASVAVVGGAERTLPGSGDAGPEGSPLPRPARPQLAYARADCDEPDTALIVGDVEGLGGYGQAGLVPLAWNRAGDHLLAVSADGERVRLLEIDDDGDIAANRAFNAVERTAGCRMGVLGFSPDANDGVVAVRRCGRSDEEVRDSLVLLRKDGRLRSTVVRLPRGQIFVDHVAFDATGHSLLYSTTPSVEAGDDSEVSLWLWRDGEHAAAGQPQRLPSPLLAALSSFPRLEGDDFAADLPQDEADDGGVVGEPGGEEVGYYVQG